MTEAGGPGGDLRLCDAERDEAARSLLEHYAVGRLDADELEDRQQAVAQARVRTDLLELFADLPGGSPVEPLSAPLPTESARWTGAAQPSGTRRAPPRFRPWRGRLPLVIRVLVALFVVTVMIGHVPFLIVLLGALWLFGHLGRTHC